MEEEKRSDKEVVPRAIQFKIWEWFLFGILIFFIFFGPYLFTRNSLLWFSFEETGPIGDTIGGITAPFVNLLAAFLVYKSFHAQINANYIQQKNHKEQLEAQQENHNQQISLITNEQSSNLLLSLFDRVSSDYMHNENTGGFGHGMNLIRGLEHLSQIPANPIEGSLDWQNLQHGYDAIDKSIGAVSFFYSNTITYLRMMQGILKKTSDSTVESVARYTYHRLQTLFEQRDYRSILKYDIDHLIRKHSIKDNTKINLVACSKSAETLRKLFIEIGHMLYPNK